MNTPKITVYQLPEDDPLFSSTDNDFKPDFTGGQQDENDTLGIYPSYLSNQQNNIKANDLYAGQIPGRVVNPMQQTLPDDVPEEPKQVIPALQTPTPEAQPKAQPIPQPQSNYKMGEAINEMDELPEYSPWDTNEVEVDETQTQQATQPEQPWYKKPLSFDEYNKQTGSSELDGLFRDMLPVKDEKLVKNNKRFAAVNSLGEMLRSIAEAIYVPKGGLATKRVNDLTQKALARIDKEETDHKTFERAHKMLLLNNELRKWNGYRNYLQQQMKNASDMELSMLEARDKFAQDQANRIHEIELAELKESNTTQRFNTEQANHFKLKGIDASIKQQELEVDYLIERMKTENAPIGPGGWGRDGKFYVNIDGQSIGLTKDKYNFIRGRIMKDPSRYEDETDRIPVTESEIETAVAANADIFIDSQGNIRSETKTGNDSYLLLRPRVIDNYTASATMNNILESNVGVNQKRKLLKELFELSPPPSDVMQLYEYDLNSVVDALLEL